MEARETKVQALIDGEKQFMLPLFQRRYVWAKKDWETLWKDIIQLYEDEQMSNHFIGSIVTIPMSSVPQGVAKYVLIDGQQRLTTLFILLTVLRDKAKTKNDERIADKINDLLVNRHESNLDYYKLIPTEKEDDRSSFIKLVKFENIEVENQISRAYSYFEREMRKTNADIQKVLFTITQRLSLVSIVLHEYDNPHLVFESLNSTGVKLYPSDLIRNYFFMRIHTDSQNEMYNKYWLPMESNFADNVLTEFIRHYLKKDGTIVKEGEIYFKLREKIKTTDAVSELQTLCKFSGYYAKLLNPEKEDNTEIRKYLQRLNTFEVTTVYPFLLNCYHDYFNNTLSAQNFIAVLQIIENFLLRRYIANVATNQLDKVFPPLYKQVCEQNIPDFVTSLKSVLQTKNYPKDANFRKAIEDSKLYGGGDKVKKTKLLLSIIEQSYGHREQIMLDRLTIEHVLPQNIGNSTWWKNHLGETWEDTHDLYVHTLGNLTLTGYNSELSNDSFEEKKKILRDSNLTLNSYFNNKETWREEDIKHRADYLAEQCLQIWPYFGEESKQATGDVRGTTPTNLIIWGQSYPVRYWADVLEQTLKIVADLDPEKLDVLISNYPRYINKNKSSLGNSSRPVEVASGIFVNKNYNAENIRKFCMQAISTIELSSDDWKVILS